MRNFLLWCRTFHIYCSLLIFVAMLFFALTGLFLNHESWFGLDGVRRSTEMGEFSADLVKSGEPDKLAIVERLRAQFNVTGALEAIELDDESIKITFKGPARHIEVTITRASGKTEIVREYQGMVALLNDLHKGRSTGSGWSIVIDVSALLMIVSAVTGLILWFTLPRRRISGIIALALGLVGGLIVYWALVP